MRVTALSLEKKTKPGRALCSLSVHPASSRGSPESPGVSSCHSTLHMLFTFQHQHPQYRAIVQILPFFRICDNDKLLDKKLIN